MFGNRSKQIVLGGELRIVFQSWLPAFNDENEEFCLDSGDVFVTIQQKPKENWVRVLTKWGILELNAHLIHTMTNRL